MSKYYYKKRLTGHSRNGKDNNSQDPKIQCPSSPLSRQSLSTSAVPSFHAGEQNFGLNQRYDMCCTILHCFHAKLLKCRG